ncbi:MAG: AAA family ATPase [Planctomycetota bacterium]
MNIKTFTAPTMREALALVRAEFGDEAAILHSRKVEGGRIKRLFRPPVIEVAATPDRSLLAEQAASNRVTPAVPQNRVAKPLAELDELIGSLPSPNDSPLVQAYGQLVDADVSPLLARRLISSAKQSLDAGAQRDLSQVSRFVRQTVEQQIMVGGPIVREGDTCQVVALVGPTGVGKTTTLAKLAANFRLRDNLRVGVVTVDTYRTGAVEQLRTYADIIDLPMEVVTTPTEMRAAVTKLSALDLVLIDTAGRSPRDGEQIDELRSLLNEAAPAETHLVLSTTATGRGLGDSITRFGAVQPTSVLLTKADETPVLGHVAKPLIDACLQISYVTDGQSVPEDIRVAERATLAAQLVGATV